MGYLVGMYWRAVVVLTVSLVSLVHGQSSQAINALVDLPSCSISCITSAVSVNNCGVNDYVCQCTHMSNITALVEPCIQSGCSNDDQTKINTLYIQNLCASPASPSVSNEAPLDTIPIATLSGELLQTSTGTARATTTATAAMATAAPPPQSSPASKVSLTPQATSSTLLLTSLSPTAASAGQATDAAAAEPSHEPLLNPAEIAGVAFGSVVGGMLLIAGLIWGLLWRRKRNALLSRQRMELDDLAGDSASAVNVVVVGRGAESRNGAGGRGESRNGGRGESRNGVGGRGGGLSRQSERDREFEKRVGTPVVKEKYFGR